MARPREFEVEEAVADAIEVFWTHGYAGASMEELIQGTGLARGSLYKAFGDKRALFLLALERYVDEALERLSAALSRPGAPKAVLQKTLFDYVKRATGEGTSRGCLLTNTATELASRDPEISKVVVRMYTRIEDLFAEAVRRAMAVKEIDPARDPRAIARFLVMTIQGIRVLAKLDPEPRRMSDAVGVALTALD